MTHSNPPRTAAIGLFSLLVGCFSPEETPTSTGPNNTTTETTETRPPSCAEVDRPCQYHTDCCDYSTVPETGSLLCIAYQEESTCNEVCTASSDCESGCCGIIRGELGFGVCSDAAYCEAGGEFRISGCGVGDAYECAGDDLIDCATSETYDCETVCVEGGFAGSGDPPCGLSSGRQVCLCV